MESSVIDSVVYYRELYEHLDKCGIPKYMRGAVIRYIMQGIPPGDFLTAVICNNLKGAVSRADETNSLLIPNYVKFFFNYAPALCWGSKELMDGWMLKKGKV